MRLAELIAAYKTDPDSPYRKLRYVTRQNYDGLMARLDLERGHEAIADIKAREALRWHEGWSSDGKVAMGHSLVGMLRTLMTFGATILDDADCRAVKVLLHDMKFKMGKPRSERLTAAQVNTIRARAARLGQFSIALAQAIQFDCTLRQKDCIGEYVPLSEPGEGIVYGDEKWMRGIRWEEIERPNLILRHVTSKRNKLVEIPLMSAPMVMEEFNRLGTLPTSGPLIICEETHQPYTAISFRRNWRLIANEVGVPKAVFNMDSRAGAITEAFSSGADPDAIRKGATHSNLSMTTRYSRGDLDAVSSVLQHRAKHRLNQG